MLKKLCLFLCLIPLSINAELLTQKRSFTVENFTTFGGKTISKVQVGWESYGELNKQKDNVILITHYFTGNSHAAGKYSKEDKEVGYWDAIIGPDKEIDTNRFFVISVDTLANIGAHNPNVITTGPASVNPDTGEPYGLTFPVVTIRDFVNVQKQLLESLGIEKLYAVAGPSMGSMQAIDWAVTYPSWVPRLISVIGSSQTDPWTSALLEHWTTPIKLDKNWRQGDYYKGEPPTEGLIHALMLITQNALSPAFFNQIGIHELRDIPIEKSALESIKNAPGIVRWLRERAKQRAASMDANHLLYLVRACQLFIAGHQYDLDSALKQIKAKSLFLPASSDLLLMPYQAELTHDKLQAAGKQSTLTHLQGDLGHLEGVSGIAKHAEPIRNFLSE